jgi:hypothetical protein
MDVLWSTTKVQDFFRPLRHYYQLNTFKTTNLPFNS